jgi:hypothetical protein
MVNPAAAVAVEVIKERRVSPAGRLSFVSMAIILIVVFGV